MFHQFFLIIFACLLGTSVKAAGTPSCFDKKMRLSFNENEVLGWRDFFAEKEVARAFVRGTLVRLLKDRQSHVHFEVDLDNDLKTTDDRVEVVYNTNFGALPNSEPGDSIIACGDFVKDSFSPFKAVIHWLHFNPRKSGHEDGFLIINGVVAGLE